MPLLSPSGGGAVLLVALCVAGNDSMTARTARTRERTRRRVVDEMVRWW